MQCCKQCGEAKPTTAYRTYYNGGTSHYKICTDCEKINSRRKYLEKKAKTIISDDEQAELHMIYELYDVQRQKGLAPPRQGIREHVIKTVVANQIAKMSVVDEVLNGWLTADLSSYTPEQLQDIYEDLKGQYRQQIGIDPKSMLPIYDDTYKITLDKILVRFDDYEEEYYG